MRIRRFTGIPRRAPGYILYPNSVRRYVRYPYVRSTPRGFGLWYLLSFRWLFR